MTAPLGYPPVQYPQPPQYQAPAYPAPAQPAYPPQQQFAPQFPVQQGYPQPQMATPAQPLVQGSLDDFFNQPSTGGGKALTFDQVGTRYIGIVTRPLGPGDVQQQTDTQQRPLFFKDGRPKFVMKVPLQLQPSAAYPDGLATWFVKGATRDELVRAMAEAGAPAGPPEAGAIIDITHTGTRPSGAGMNPAKLFAVVYRRPDGAAPTQVIQQPPPQQPLVEPQAPAQVQYAPPQPPVQQAQQMPPGRFAQPTGPVQYTQPEVQQQQFTPPPIPPAPAPQAPSGMTAEQQALLAKLTGG